jgi:hypothetical protein
MIEVDKVNLKILKDSSWKLLFLESVDNYTDYLPGGLNLKFSLSPHISFSKSVSRYGADEVIFKPFIKTISYA